MGNDYTEFVRSIKQQTGIDLGLYKEKQMKRRLTSLRDKRGFDTFSGYFDAVKNNRSLLTELLDQNDNQCIRIFSKSFKMGSAEV